MAGVANATMVLALLVGCDKAAADKTIAQIIASIQTGCGILLGPSGVNQVINVILTILSTFNPTAGAAAMVPAAIAAQVEKLICDAFKASLSAPENRTATAGQTITVMVNGVPVTGTVVLK
jgi:hypothetical protein